MHRDTRVARRAVQRDEAHRTRCIVLDHEACRLTRLDHQVAGQRAHVKRRPARVGQRCQHRRRPALDIHSPKSTRAATCNVASRKHQVTARTGSLPFPRCHRHRPTGSVRAAARLSRDRRVGSAGRRVRRAHNRHRVVVPERVRHTRRDHRTCVVQRQDHSVAAVHDVHVLPRVAGAALNLQVVLRLRSNARHRESHIVCYRVGDVHVLVHRDTRVARRAVQRDEAHGRVLEQQRRSIAR